MRFSGLVVVMMMSICFASNAQTREDYTLQAEHVDISKSIEIFPNPAIDFVHVRIDQLPAQNVKLTLHNIIGNEMKIETEVVDAHELRVRVKDLAAGYYLLALKDDETKFRGTFKFLKR